nr:MAG TPA: hypothetical protein [Bacteriophage sp.]
MKLEKSIVFHSPNQIWLRCYSVSIDDLFYTTFRPYTTKAHSYLGALVVVF